MRIVAFIPIKLHSQRLPGKNILPLAGRPLCWHMANTLLRAKGIDEVYIYCSDEAILRYLPYGVRLKIRDRRLDGDQVKGFEIYDSFIKEVEADVYVLAHATSPFLSVYSVENALRHISQYKCDSAFSAKRIQSFAWYGNRPINYDSEDIPRTQDLEPIWVETSGFFMFKKEILTVHHRRIGFHPYIQEVSGPEAIDIDGKKDYDYAVMMAKMEGINYE